MSQSLFEKIANGEIPAYKIWENKDYLAFLTPFANTDGATVVIPKTNIGDYIFALDNEACAGLLLAAKEVSKLLEKAFDTPRVALVFEGTGVAHVHAKLYPLHGELAAKTNVWSTHQEYYPKYIGYLTTVEGPEMSSVRLSEIQSKIEAVQL